MGGTITYHRWTQRREGDPHKGHGAKMSRKFPLTGAIEFSIHTKFSDEFIDFLVKQFEIPDRDALIKAILVAKNAYDDIHLFGEKAYAFASGEINIL